MCVSVCVRVRVRIAGDTALCKNIHESVSRQIRKNFAKSKWRVNALCSLCFCSLWLPESVKYQFNRVLKELIIIFFLKDESLL